MKRFLFLLLMILNIQCQQSFKAQTSSSAFNSQNCAQAGQAYRNAFSFKNVVALINQLPKPLTINCFLANYDPPFNIYAVDSTFSAQPAEGPGSPRIFIIKDSFALSVVPTNTAQVKLEFAQVLDSANSIKGELEFPILSNIADSAPFDQIRYVYNGIDGTNCRGCHFNEIPVPGVNGAFSSLILDPDPTKSVSTGFLRQELQSCDYKNEPQRCNILQNIFGRGSTTQINWPF